MQKKIFDIIKKYIVKTAIITVLKDRKRSGSELDPIFWDRKRSDQDRIRSFVREKIGI